VELVDVLDESRSVDSKSVLLDEDVEVEVEPSKSNSVDVEESLEEDELLPNKLLIVSETLVSISCISN
jgi:hypothetical protein